jgi:hypothetical protein
LRFHPDFEPTLLKAKKYGKTDASMSKSLFPLKFAQVYKMTVLMFLRKKHRKFLEFCDIFKNILFRRHASNRLEILVIGIVLAGIA